MNEDVLVAVRRQIYVRMMNHSLSNHSTLPHLRILEFNSPMATASN